MTDTAPTITDIAKKTVDELRAERSDSASRANVYSRLAVAQQMKAANIIAYLNSDHSLWAAEDEVVVRQYLGLSAGLEAEPEPEPEAADKAFPEAPSATPVAPSFDEDF